MRLISFSPFVRDTDLKLSLAGVFAVTFNEFLQASGVGCSPNQSAVQARVNVSFNI